MDALDPHTVGPMPRRAFIRASTAALSLVAGGCAGAAHATPGARASGRRASSWIPDDSILTALPEWMRLAQVPGLAMAVVERGAVAWRGNFGVVNATTGGAVTDDTLFEAASMTKAVFAYAVLRLAEQGKLALDAPLVDVFRPAYFPTDARIDRITARHVLSHTSGLPNWGDDAKPETLRPAFDAGTRFRYSGEGYFWLQLAVEHLTGVGLDRFMRDMVLDPAGMRDSAFTLDEAMLPRLAFGHQEGRPDAGHGTRGVMQFLTPRATAWNIPLREWRHAEWLRTAAELDPRNPARRVRFMNAASSMITTAGDFARFLAHVVVRPTRAPWELSPALHAAMLTPHIAVREGSVLGWGLGWTIERTPRGLRCGHEGNNDGRFTCYSGADIAEGRALVVLTNAAGGFGVYQRLVRELTGLDQLSFIAGM